MNPVDEILLDEYGNPIGQLVVNMGQKETALAMPDTAMATAQVDALSDIASELPGIAPEEIAVFYPGYDDPDKRNKAKKLFLTDGHEVPDIATAIAVPERTVLMWIANNHWAEARRREIVAKDEISRLSLAETRINMRNAVFHEQLEQAKRIRKTAIDGIELEKISVKSGAEAWAAAAKTEQTILGLSDAGKISSAVGRDDDDDDNDGKKTKAPLVVVVQGGGLPPIRPVERGL